MALVFVPVVIATIALVQVHRRARLRDEKPPLAITIATGIMVGLVAAESGLAAIAVLNGPR